MRKRAWLAVGMAFVLAAAACGANGDQSSTEDDPPPAEADGDGVDLDAFGTLDSPCGEDIDGVTVSLDPAEAGRGTDRIHIGVANERTAEVRPGLLKEMYDAMVAFAGWCNAQGGIGGVPVEVVDLDGQLTRVEAAMTSACSETFAMVGGGWVQDNLAFTGKPGSDFHQCGMIAVTGFAVSTEFAEANGVIQPIPNAAYRKPSIQFADMAELYPEEVRKTAMVYGDGVPSLRITKDQNRAVMEAVGGYGFTDEVTYALINQDFSVTAQKIIDLGATSIGFVGEPENYAALLAELQTKGWEGLAASETNHYDEKLFTRGDSAPNGAVIRMAIHYFEEADEFPVMQQLEDLLTEYGPDDVKIASLSIQSFSAGLLFAQTVRDCAADNDGRVDRECVVTTAKTYTEWDGGGLHAPGDLSDGVPPECGMLVVARDGTFERLFPEIGGAEDDGDGFHCGEILELEGDFGEPRIDPSRPY